MRPPCDCALHQVLTKPGAVWAAYPVSREVEAAVEALEAQRATLFELQSEAGLTKWNEALLVDLRFAGELTGFETSGPSACMQWSGDAASRRAGWTGTGCCWWACGGGTLQQSR
jgi:hypothetical protein